MIRIGILGDIGSGKTFVANNFGYPVFNADNEVASLYRKDKLIYLKLKRELPNYFNSFPVKKKDISSAILDKKTNLRKIVKIIHTKIRKNLSLFLRRNKTKKIIILDIPLLLENKINHKNDILIFIDSKKSDVLKRLRKRKNYNQRLFSYFRKIQLPLSLKKSKSHFIIKNNFTKKSVNRDIKNILKKILK